MHTAACDLLGCEYPVILAGMGGVARADLVAAVSEAGGYGFLGMVREPAEFILAQISAVRRHTDREFGVNLIPAATPPALLAQQVAVCLSEHVNSVSLFWDVAPELIALFRRAAITVVAQVGSVVEAERAVDAGAQMIVAQGIGAGGHVRGVARWSDLLHEIASRCDVPIVVAGGIADGAGLAEAISLGADGVMLGTAFLATHESFAHSYHKKRITESQGGETVYTDSFHWNWPRGAPVRVLANSVTRGERGDPYQEPRIEIGSDGGRPIFLFSTDSPLRTTTGELDAMAIYAGEGTAKIDQIVSASERIASIVSQASRLLSAAPASGAATHQALPFASSACGASDADDNYVGYAPREEVLHFLGLCLAIKKVSARATIGLATALKNDQARKAVRRIYQDDAECCQCILETLTSLGGEPSREAGCLDQTVPSCDGVFERLSFVQQQQERIIKLVSQMLPRIGNDDVYSCLESLLARQVVGVDAIYRLACADVLD